MFICLDGFNAILIEPPVGSNFLESTTGENMKKVLLLGLGIHGYKSLGIDRILINPNTSNYQETSFVTTSASILLSI